MYIIGLAFLIIGISLGGSGIIIGYLKIVIEMIKEGDYLWAATIIGLTLLIIGTLLIYANYQINVKPVEL